MRDSEAIADVVVTTMKAALAPVLERLAAAEARWSSVSDVRDRLIVLETKAAIPVPMPEIPPPVDLSPFAERLAVAEKMLGGLPERMAVEIKAAQAALPVVTVPEPTPVDLSPLTMRLSAAEAQLGLLTDVRDRVIVMETKTALPVPVPEIPVVDLSPLTERLAAVDVRLASLESSRDAEALTALHERVAVVETKAAQPMPPVDFGQITQRQDAIETAMTAHFNAVVTEIGKDIVAVKERLTAVEVRGAIPGPPGPAGQDGKDGKDGAPGKDGQDGIVLDDVSMTQEDERSFKFSARLGSKTKEYGPFTVPAQIFRGVWVEGKTYDRGDCATYGGSEWHCNETTTSKPGDGSKAWTLIVKRGRDGKDGRDATGVLPVVKVG